MYRLIEFGLMLVGAWYLWRRFRRQFFRRTEPAAAPERPKTVANQPVTLERDPKTGIFRPPEG